MIGDRVGFRGEVMNLVDARRDVDRQFGVRNCTHHDRDDMRAAFCRDAIRV